MSRGIKNQFVIGIGSQRAGSTLLYTLLTTSPQISMHPVKELHYFDVLDGIREEHVNQKFSKTRLINNFAGAWKRLPCQTLVAMETNYTLTKTPLREITYQSLYKRISPKHKYLGEVTPAYMLLSDEGLRNLKNTVGDAKIILVSRDPYDRVVSALKLLLRGQAENMKLETKESMDKYLLKVLDSKRGKWVEKQSKFNDYPGAEARFRRFFTDVLVIAYDELVNIDRSIDILQGFLGVPFDRKKFSKRLKKKVNQTSLSYEISEAVERKIRDQFHL